MFYDRATGRGQVSTRRALLAGGAGLFGAGVLPGCAACRSATPPAPGAPSAGSARAPSEAALPDGRSGSDQLFAHVVDQSKSVTPIAAGERAERRVRLKRILASLGGGALLLEGGATMTYLTGVSWWRSERLF